MAREHAKSRHPDQHLSRLLDSWASRDEQYAADRYTMSSETESAVRAGRREEIEQLPFVDRSTALAVLHRWSPPTPIRMLTLGAPPVRTVAYR